ncbi:MAG: quinolinate synthase NadA [Desulfobacterales bacterium]
MNTNELKANIRHLLKERNAIFLAHNYQPPEIQDLADLCGDSLELSIQAARTDAAVILFCGVHFMAETAAILSPEKTVLLPRADAGCPMAEMIDPDSLRARIDELPPMPVVTYVNSSAAVKALSTICCTSANAVAVVESLDAEAVLMTPDRNLARYPAARTKKKVHIWEGCCPFHDRLTPEDDPKAVFMAHPECRPEVLELADVITSTSGMLRTAAESDSSRFIVGTEVGLLYPLKKANPSKEFFPASDRMLCEDMKKISLHDVLRSLEQLHGRVTVPEDIRRPAFAAVQRMIDLAL